jgi:hypothetical protein
VGGKECLSVLISQKKGVEKYPGEHQEHINLEARVGCLTEDPTYYMFSNIDDRHQHEALGGDI